MKVKEFARIEDFEQELYSVSDNGNLEDIKAFLLQNHNAINDIKGDMGWTILHSAAVVGKTDVVKAILQVSTEAI